MLLYRTAWQGTNPSRSPGFLLDLHLDFLFFLKQVKLPVGTYGRIAPRSGLALKQHIGVGAGLNSEMTSSKLN